MESDVRKLIRSIRELTLENRKTNSLRNNFFKGVMFGVGSAIGASVIAAIVIGFIAKFFQSVKNINFY